MKHVSSLITTGCLARKYKKSPAILQGLLLIFILYACHILYYCADATIFPPIYLYS